MEEWALWTMDCPVAECGMAVTCFVAHWSENGWNQWEV